MGITNYLNVGEDETVNTERWESTNQKNNQYIRHVSMLRQNTPGRKTQNRFQSR